MALKLSIKYIKYFLDVIFFVSLFSKYCIINFYFL